MMKRRDLLKMGGGSLALAGLGLARPALAAGDNDANGVAAAAGNGFRWSQAGATALVGQQFWVNHPQQGAIGLTLESVRGFPAAAVPPSTPEAAIAAARAPAIEQFSLIFTGPAGSGCASGSYEMDHAQIGRFALFLTPGEKRIGANTYRADFSLLA